MNKSVTNIILILIGLFAGLILCELTLRIFYPQPAYPMNRDYFFYHKYDSEIGWVLKENSRGLDRPNPQEPAVHVAINGRGYRGREYPLEKVTGKKRILVLGDSITFGYGVEENASYSAILQKMLGDNFEVINSGVAGYGLDQEYLLFMREGVKYRPDLIIVGFSGGDIYDITCSTRFGIPKPYFRSVDGRLTLFKPPPVVDKISDKEIFFRGKPFQAFLFGKLHIYRLLFYRFSDQYKESDVSVQEMNMLEGKRVASEIIGSLKKLCDERGCRLLFLVIPQEDWLKGAARSKYSEIFKIGHNSAVDILEETGIPYIDLWEPFLSESGKELFLKGDYVHPNQKGNRVIAERIRKRLMDDRLL